MPIGPVTNSHREISVVEAVSPALERVKVMLFKPFNLGKWFTIGFCAWLAYLGEGGGSGFNYNNNFSTSSHNQNSGTESFRHFYDQARDFVTQNLYWIVPAVIFAVLFFLALWLVILWLNSRGKFMFLHCVALDKAEVAEPWSRFAPEANSLFRFRIVLGLAGMVLLLPPLVSIIVLIARMVLRGAPDMGGIMLAAGSFLFLLLAAIVLALIQKFTLDFVVPIQFLRGGKCRAAWKEFWGLLSANPGQFTLYILFQFVLGMGIGVIVLGAVLLTCCIAGCLIAIPYLGTVLLLPILVFQRSYSLYYLAQFGPAYNVFPPALTQPPAAPPSGLQPLAPT